MFSAQIFFSVKVKVKTVSKEKFILFTTVDAIINGNITPPNSTLTVAFTYQIFCVYLFKFIYSQWLKNILSSIHVVNSCHNI